VDGFRASEAVHRVEFAHEEAQPDSFHFHTTYVCKLQQPFQDQT
jgi:hypothetical protein